MARSRHVEEKLHGQFRVVGLHGKVKLRRAWLSGAPASAQSMRSARTAWTPSPEPVSSTWALPAGTRRGNKSCRREDAREPAPMTTAQQTMNSS